MMKNKKLIAKERLNQIGINNQGLEMKIIEYKRANNITIQFLNDNYIIYNKRYEHFLNGSIKHPNYKSQLFINRVGERNQNINGDWMEIIECFGSKNNTIKFDDDGSIKINVSYRCFKNGLVAHPIRYEESLLYAYRDISEMIAIPENNISLKDCRYITYGSENKYYVKCPYCNKISNDKKFLYSLTYKGYSCEFCSDGISLPNKVLRQISKQLNLNWVFEYNEKWMGKCKFDAYDKTLRQPIEMDAKFCIIKNDNKMTDNHNGIRKEIDNWKDEEAIKHNIKSPRRVNLMNDKEYYNNTFDYIKKQLYLAIGDLYNLDKLDWNKIFIDSQKSLMIEACKLWQEGIYSTTKICEILKLSRSTVLIYLKRGNKLGICNYTKEKSYKELGKTKRNNNHPNANLYIVIKSNGEKYSELPLCSKDIYDKGFLKIKHEIFNKYIKPYGVINIDFIKNIGISDYYINKLLPYDGWKFILL